MRHEWSLAIKYVKPSQAMFVRPAQHVPTHSTANEKRSSMHWHGALGAEVLGQAAIHSPPEGEHMSPANMVMRDATNAVGSDILGVPSTTTTPNTIHLSAQPHHSMLILILLGLAGNDLFQQIWKVIPCTRTCDLASAFRTAFRQGCQITKFTKFKINSRNLGSTFLHKSGLVVLHQHVINFQQWHFWGKTQNISAKILVLWEVFCWAKSCKERPRLQLF